MAMRFSDLLKAMRPLTVKDKANLQELEQYLSAEKLSKIRWLIRQKRVGVSSAKIGVSKNLMMEDNYPELFQAREDKELEKLVKAYNKQIVENLKLHAYRALAPQANILKEFLAPNILGLDTEKEACILQLFAKERIHILLLGDPGTGKTDILRGTADLAPLSRLGLGSGTSGVGLGAMAQGNEKIPGLLPQADQGLCCIDELNLMKNQDRASLYNAMEKGFVSYNKGTMHFDMNARVRVLATANPKGDKFAGKFIDTLKKQLPFDPALLSRFHLVFLIRKPDLRGFVQITKKIIRDDAKQLRAEDAKFIKGYIKLAEDIEVNFPKKFEKKLLDFVKQIKEDEKRYLIEVSPRLVVGFIRMAKASARMHLRKEVDDSDIDHVKDIVQSSLIVR